MKLLLLVTVIGFAQLCSSAPATTKNESSTGSWEAKYLEISERLKVIPGVNLQRVDELIHITKKTDGSNPFSVVVESTARYYSLLFDLDFAKVNQSMFELERDFHGFGRDIPTENRTFSECFGDYYSKTLLNESPKEFESKIEEIFQQLKSALTKGVEASKARKIDYYLQTFQNLLANFGKEGETARLMDFFVFTYHNGAGVSERAACGVAAEVFEWRFDCTKYANEEKGDSEAENGENQSENQI
ncbi:uncharacterized protein LOC129574591 [Sitodiplosis mosellana]|uniref:uncharacterized protein LOC129574591 n=1 Tax=Sitodiplosis mosellana TaxID=263140 RepID=UPI0024440D9D|nr:uncharacterized protein LOC129574591 [Sitodiplosis mosellana]